MGAYYGNGRSSSGLGRDDDYMIDNRSETSKTAYITNMVGKISSYGSNGYSDSQVELGGFNQDSYTDSGKDFFSGMLNGVEDDTGQNEYRDSIVFQATRIGDAISSQLALKAENHYLVAVNQAIKNFRRPTPDSKNEDPVFCLYTDEIINNLKFYRWLCTYACLALSHDISQYIIAGREKELNTSRDLQMKLMYGAFMDVMMLQFIPWLAGRKELAKTISMLTPDGRRTLDSIDRETDALKPKFLFLQSSNNVEIPYPWKKGLLAQIKEKAEGVGGYSTYISPVHNETQKDICSYFNDSYRSMKDTTIDHGSSIDHIRRLSHSGANVNTDVAPCSYFSASGWRGDDIVQVDPYSNRMDIKDITPRNREDYKFLDYFIPIGDSGYYLCDTEDFRYIEPTLECDKKLRWFPSLGKFPGDCVIFRVDWNKGFYSYKMIDIGDNVMSDMLTDPDKVLPYMYVDEEDQNRATYNKSVLNQDVLIKNGVPITVEECNELEEIPSIVYGNKPLVPQNSLEAITTLNTLCNLHDPNKQLDALIIPVTFYESLQLEEEVDVNKVYDNLKWMTKNSKHGELDTRNLIRNIQIGLTRIGSLELTNFVRDHLTNVINGYLIDKRFYTETNNYNENVLRIDDAFNDFNDLCEVLENKDNETLIELIKYGSNEFIRDGFEILSTSEEASKYRAKQISKIDDEVIKIAKQKSLNQSIILKRNMIIGNFRKMNPIPGFNLVRSGKSHRPMLNYIYKEALKNGRKHFNQDYTPFMFIFDRDEHIKLWSMNTSSFDDNMLTIRSVGGRKPLAFYENVITK